jgi:hypothetical protein
MFPVLVTTPWLAITAVGGVLSTYHRHNRDQGAVAHIIRSSRL